MGTDRAAVRAWFPDHATAKAASRRLVSEGVPEPRILFDSNAPAQSPAPVDTARRDVATEKRSLAGGAGGLLLGAILGAALGAAVGTVLAEAFSPAWFGFVIGGGLFVMGIGLLWGMLLRTPEGAHYGTVTDPPGQDDAAPLIVRTQDEAEADRIARLLREAGGSRVEDVPTEELDPER